MLAGALSDPPAQVAICAGTQVLVGAALTSTNAKMLSVQMLSGLVVLTLEIF